MNLRLNKCPLCEEFDIAFFFDGKNAEYDICKNCGLIFNNPQIDLNYENYGKSNPDIEMEYYTSVKRKLFLDKYFLKKNKFILEIGCSYGTFLDLMKKDGWNVKGYEPSKTQHKISRKINPDLDIENDYFTKSLKKYGVIAFFHVLEHIKEPLNFMRFIEENLDDKGLLYIEVPEVFRPGHTDLKRLYQAGHYYMYDISSLEFLLKKAGFRIFVYERMDTCVEGALSIIACKKEYFSEYARTFQNNYLYERNIDKEISQLKYNINREERIIIFGVNNFTESLIVELKDEYKIVSIIDSFYTESCFMEIPVIKFQQLGKIKFDKIIISSFNSIENISILLKEFTDKIIIIFDRMGNIPYFNNVNYIDESIRVLRNRLIKKYLEKIGIKLNL